MVIRDNQSESEAEEAEGEVTVVQQQTRVEHSHVQPSAVKLTEVSRLWYTKSKILPFLKLGPRMTLQLVKVEAGMCSGEVLHHQFSK